MDQKAYLCSNMALRSLKVKVDSHPCGPAAEDKCQVTLNLALVKPQAGEGRALNNR